MNEEYRLLPFITGVLKRVARSPEAGRFSAGLVDSDSHIARRASDILEDLGRRVHEFGEPWHRLVTDIVNTAYVRARTLLPGRN